MEGGNAQINNDTASKLEHQHKNHDDFTEKQRDQTGLVYSVHTEGQNINRETEH